MLLVLLQSCRLPLAPLHQKARPLQMVPENRSRIDTHKYGPRGSDIETKMLKFLFNKLFNSDEMGRKLRKKCTPWYPPRGVPWYPHLEVYHGILNHSPQ